jgi:hypothetical protein
VSLKQVMKSATFTGRAPYRGCAADTPPGPQLRAGAMFWLTWKTLPGS